METTIDYTNNVLTLHLNGRLTADRHDEGLPATVRRMARSGAKWLVLDLRDVSYMDSTCLGEIVEASMSLRRCGGQLRLVNVPPRVQHLLDISRLGDLLFDRSTIRPDGRTAAPRTRLSGAVAS